MKHAPNSWTGHSLIAHVKTGPQASRDGKRYEPARPMGFYSIASRLRLAWAVFTGQADALFWEWTPSTRGER